MPRVFINLEAGCLQVNLMSTSAQINQLKYTILYYDGRTVLGERSMHDGRTVNGRWTVLRGRSLRDGRFVRDR